MPRWRCCCIITMVDAGGGVAARFRHLRAQNSLQRCGIWTHCGWLGHCASYSTACRARSSSKTRAADDALRAVLSKLRKSPRRPISAGLR
jgi:hypothetical protein